MTRQINEIGGVDVRGLPPEEKMLVAFLTVVDPRDYNGWSACLVQQTEKSLKIPSDHDGGWGAVARYFGVQPDVVSDIYGGVTFRELRDDYDRSVRFAARKLAVSRERLAALARRAGRKINFAGRVPDDV